MIHVTQTSKLVSSSLDLTPRRCLYVLQAWEDHFRVSGASHPQPWSSSLMPLVLSNPQWGAGVTFFPLLNRSTFTVKQYVAFSLCSNLASGLSATWIITSPNWTATLPSPHSTLPPGVCFLKHVPIWESVPTEPGSLDVGMRILSFPPHPKMIPWNRQRLLTSDIWPLFTGSAYLMGDF